MNWINDCFLALAAEYNNPGALVAAIHAGSSAHGDPREALDVDIILFVKGTHEDGSIYIEHEGMRVEGIVFAIELADTHFSKALRTQRISLLDMIVNGRQIYGDEATLAPVKAKAQAILDGARPLFIKPVAAFSGHTWLRLLRRARRPTDVAAVAVGILDFIAKMDGPRRGRWPVSVKRLLRQDAASPDTLDLLPAFQKAVCGDKADFIQRFERWLADHDMHDETSFRMLVSHKQAGAA